MSERKRVTQRDTERERDTHKERQRVIEIYYIQRWRERERQKKFQDKLMKIDVRMRS